MPDHEPFDGTVPCVLKGVADQLPESVWIAVRPGAPRVEAFATWREAMNYATKEKN